MGNTISKYSHTLLSTEDNDISSEGVPKTSEECVNVAIKTYITIFNNKLIDETYKKLRPCLVLNIFEDGTVFIRWLSELDYVTLEKMNDVLTEVLNNSELHLVKANALGTIVDKDARIQMKDCKIKYGSPQTFYFNAPQIDGYVSLIDDSGNETQVSKQLFIALEEINSN